ncbi:MAG: Do family serine endopeptidase [Flavobacteriaceae bacterium]
MTTPTTPRNRRLRAALLAGAAVAGLSLTAVQPVLNAAQAAEVPAPTFNAPETGFADLVEKVSPAVVSVIVESDGKAEQMAAPDLDQIPEPFRRFFGPDTPFGKPKANPGQRRHMMGQGSGFFISADGYLVTNNHVVEDATKVTVKLDSGKQLPGKVVGTDKKTDLALVKVEGDDFPFVNLSDKDARVGDWVVAVGNPFGLGGTVTAGIVSARGRDIGAGPYDDFLQIDASVNRGNSGGPTFSLDGDVIGVNTAIFSPSGGNVGIAFAIPSSTVKQVVGELKAKGTVSRGWLGVQIQPVTEEIAQGLGMDKARGALVAQTLDNGPAGKAGVRVGDAIVALNGTDLQDARDLVRRIGAMDPGEEANLTVWRDGKEKTVSLKLADQPDEQKMASADDTQMPSKGDEESSLGLSLAPGSQFGTDGVVIADVDADGPAAEVGLEAGQIIIQANGSDVSSPRDVVKAVDDARANSRKSVLLLVRPDKDASPRFVAVPLRKA